MTPDRAREFHQIDAATRRALARAEQHGIEVNLYKMRAQWVCSCEGELAHVNDLPKLVEAAIDRLEKAEAA